MAFSHFHLGVLVLTIMLLIPALPARGADGTPPATPVAEGAVQELLSLPNQPGISALAYSPDGGTLATVGSGASVWLRDADDRFDEPLVLPQSNPADPEEGHPPKAYSPDGSLLAVGRDDGSVQLWDVNRPDDVPSLIRIHTEPVGDLAFSPDGATLATGSWDETIRLHDLTGLAAEPTIIHAGSLVSGIALSPDGALVAAGLSDHSVRIWRLDQPDAEPLVLVGHEASVFDVVFSPDGSLLASGSDDETVRIWTVADLASNPTVLQADHPDDHFGALAFSPDGTTVAAGGSFGQILFEGLVWLWDVRQPEQDPAVISFGLGGVGDIAWRPASSTLAATFVDGSVRLIDTAEPQAKPTTVDYPDGMDVALDPLTTTMAAGGPHGELWLWDIDNPGDIPREIDAHQGQVSALAYSPDGVWLASAGFAEGRTGAATVHLWDTSDLDAEPLTLSLEMPVSTIAFSPDGDTLAISLWDTTVRLWDLARPTSSPTTLVTETEEFAGDGVASFAFSPDGQYLAGGSGNGPVLIWDLDQPEAKPRQLTHEHNDTSYTEALWDIAFSPDARLLVAVGQSGHLLAWDLSGLRPEPIDLALPDTSSRLNRRPLEYGYTVVAFSPDGEGLLVGGVDATGATVLYRWEVGDLMAAPVDLAVGQAIGSPISGVTFGPDRATLTTVTFGGAVHRWNLAALPATPVTAPA